MDPMDNFFRMTLSRDTYNPALSEHGSDFFRKCIVLQMRFISSSDALDLCKLSIKNHKSVQARTRKAFNREPPKLSITNHKSFQSPTTKAFNDGPQKLSTTNRKSFKTRTNIHFSSDVMIRFYI